MTFPEVELDDRRFQDLVNEARLRIAQSCPEWTEHNLSDPGITLIELFAWMTDMLTYRVNRIPDKLHVALLQLIGVQPHGPTGARADVRFELTAPAREELVIPARATEVGTLRTATTLAVVFQVAEDFRIPPVRPSAYVVERSGDQKALNIAGGVARPQADDRRPFGNPPRVDDALYLGFDEDIGRLVIQVEVEGSEARGAGINPDDPPLRWEVSRGSDGWADAEVLEDRTGGFNRGSGAVRVQCPSECAITSVAGLQKRWLRCRISNQTRSGETGGRYTHAPVIHSLTAAAVGALVPMEHARTEVNEQIGISDGTPGQRFALRFAPVLPLGDQESLEVRDPEASNWTPWNVVDSFAQSGAADPHFKLDPGAGEVELGPAVRQPDGGWRQYGAVPVAGSELRMSRYRHGGGRDGNVLAGALTVLRSAIAGVATVTNPAPATGGVDPEPLASARQRAGMEIRSRYRAVTSEDYEFLARQASPRVARAVCIAPASSEDAIRVHLLPRLASAQRRLSFDELTPDESLLHEVARYLEPRRPIGTTVDILPVALRPVSIVVNLVAESGADLQRVEEEVLQALYTYVNPLVGGSIGGPGEGWQFGRTLNLGELYQVVHGVSRVEFVRVLRVYETELQTGEESPQPAGSHIELQPHELIASARHVVKAIRPTPS